MGFSSNNQPLGVESPVLQQPQPREHMYDEGAYVRLPAIERSYGQSVDMAQKRMKIGMAARKGQDPNRFCPRHGKLFTAK